jgi:hypothetical protein
MAEVLCCWANWGYCDIVVGMMRVPNEIRYCDVLVEADQYEKEKIKKKNTS